MTRVLDFWSHQINEASDDKTGTKETLINVFFEAFNNALEKADLTTSYSVLASRDKSSPDKDMAKVMELMSKEGWKKKPIDALFNKYGDTILDLYNNGEGKPKEFISGVETSLIPSGSGVADLFFFRMSHGKNILSGIDYKDQAIDQPGEFYIKYGYGYHKTRYGTLVIKAQFGSLDKWFDHAAIHLLDGFIVHEQDYLLDTSFEDFLQSIKGVTSDKFKKIFGSALTHKEGKGEIDLTGFETLVSTHHFDALKTQILKRLGEMGFKVKGTDIGKGQRGGTAEMKDNKIILNFEG